MITRSNIYENNTNEAHVVLGNGNKIDSPDNISIKKGMNSNIPSVLTYGDSGSAGNTASFTTPNKYGITIGDSVQIWIGDYLQFTGVIDEISGSFSDPTTVQVNASTPLERLDYDFTWQYGGIPANNVLYERDWHECVRYEDIAPAHSLGYVSTASTAFPQYADHNYMNMITSFALAESGYTMGLKATRGKTVAYAKTPKFRFGFIEGQLPSGLSLGVLDRSIASKSVVDFNMVGSQNYNVSLYSTTNQLVNVVTTNTNGEKAVAITIGSTTNSLNLGAYAGNIRIAVRWVKNSGWKLFVRKSNDKTNTILETPYINANSLSTQALGGDLYIQGYNNDNDCISIDKHDSTSTQPEAMLFNGSKCVYKGVLAGTGVIPNLYRKKAGEILSEWTAATNTPVWFDESDRLVLGDGESPSTFTLDLMDDLVDLSYNEVLSSKLTAITIEASVFGRQTNTQGWAENSDVTINPGETKDWFISADEYTIFPALPTTWGTKTDFLDKVYLAFSNQDGTAGATYDRSIGLVTVDTLKISVKNTGTKPIVNKEIGGVLTTPRFTLSRITTIQDYTKTAQIVTDKYAQPKTLDIKTELYAPMTTDVERLLSNLKSKLEAKDSHVKYGQIDVIEPDLRMQLNDTLTISGGVYITRRIIGIDITLDAQSGLKQVLTLQQI